MPEFREEDLRALQKAVDHLAPLVARYMAGLIEGGLSRAEALELTKEWQRGLLAGAQASRPCPSCGKSPCAGTGTGCRRVA